MARSRLRFNFQKGSVGPTTLSSADLVLYSAELANLPAIDATEYCAITLDPSSDDGAPEVVYVTAHTASSTSATITRGEEGSSQREHLAGTTWKHATTKVDFVETSGLTINLNNTSQRAFVTNYEGTISSGSAQYIGAEIEVTPKITGGSPSLVGLVLGSVYAGNSVAPSASTGLFMHWDAPAASSAPSITTPSLVGAEFHIGAGGYAIVTEGVGVIIDVVDGLGGQMVEGVGLRINDIMADANKDMSIQSGISPSQFRGSIAIGGAARSTRPQVSSSLDLQATDKALTLNRIASVSSIATPIAGMLVYETSTSQLKFYNGISWQKTTGGILEEYLTPDFQVTSASASGGVYQPVVYGDLPEKVAEAGDILILEGSFSITNTTAATSVNVTHRFRIGGNTYATSGVKAYANQSGVSFAHIVRAFIPITSSVVTEPRLEMLASSSSATGTMAGFNESKSIIHNCTGAINLATSQRVEWQITFSASDSLIFATIHNRTLGIIKGS